MTRIKRKYHFLFMCFMFLAVAGVCKEPRCKSQIHACVEKAWNTSWMRFYKPKTHLFYDYLSSYVKGEELAHLPTADEVNRQYPNNCGYGTGMEDGMISAGVMLSMIVDRYSVMREENLRACAHEVFKGIRLCTMGHGITGFVARAVCHEDLTAIYISSSRDQYTHVVHGLWHYFKSPLPDAEIRGDIVTVLSAIADRMLRNVIPENGYCSLRADGTVDDRGISRMWMVKGHEAARLPMIYAAAWDVTGEQKYYDQYRKYIEPAINQSLEFENAGPHPTYALLQMQGSLELLKHLETDDVVRKKIEQAMSLVSMRCAQRADSATQRSMTLNLRMLGPDWRESGGLVGDYRTVWYCIRECGEAFTAQLMDNKCDFSPEQCALLTQCIIQLDYDNVSSCGIYNLQAAYWKARARGLFSN